MGKNSRSGLLGDSYGDADIESFCHVWRLPAPLSDPVQIPGRERGRRDSVQSSTSSRSSMQPVVENEEEEDRSPLNFNFIPRQHGRSEADFLYNNPMQRSKDANGTESASAAAAHQSMKRQRLERKNRREPVTPGTNLGLNHPDVD